MAESNQLRLKPLRDWPWRRIVTAVPVSALLIFLLGGGLTTLADFAADSIYKNAYEPLDLELPVTVTSFRSGTDVVSTIGGRGEGLNCSLPRGIDIFFQRSHEGKRSPFPVAQRFRQACVFHDLCYRHGLATYGYTQNDCDELLQEQAFRICISLTDSKTLTECQIDAKKVVGGVKLGGFKAFARYNRSTYFEFDPNPYRSRYFHAVRAVDHPFKGEHADKLGSEPEQLLANFRIMRGGVQFSCINCNLPNTVPPEFDLSKLRTWEKDFWIPSGRLYAAPYIMADGGGKSKLVWLSRQNFEDSTVCVAVVDPNTLLTKDARPDHAGCYPVANPKLGLARLDLLSSALQLSMVAPPRSGEAQAQPSIVVTGLTAQCPGGLALCVSKDMRKGEPHDADTSCDEITNVACRKIYDLEGKQLKANQHWGAFQNFPIVRGQRHVYLSRSMRVDDDETGSNTVRPLAFEVTHQHMPDNKVEAQVKLISAKSVDIPDALDPIMPISMRASDMRFLSISTRDGMLNFFEIDLASEKPKPEPVKLTVNSATGSANIMWPRSWARRPILVAETEAAEAEKKTRLILSRSKVTTKEGGGMVDKVRFEFAILERPAAPSAQPAPLGFVRGLTCDVTYTVKKPDPNGIRPCRRVATGSNAERATPANRLQGAQLMVGRFGNGGEPTLALIDRCLRKSPVILSINAATPVPSDHDAVLGRDVQCTTLGEDGVAKEKDETGVAWR